MSSKLRVLSRLAVLDAGRLYIVADDTTAVTTTTTPPAAAAATATATTAAAATTTTTTATATTTIHSSTTKHYPLKQANLWRVVIPLLAQRVLGTVTGDSFPNQKNS